ncbi:hypothetical protein AX15_002621 [Amanita polypyramis BW_CC]|nr:hypothetical protein AX15_002621 [Amanita polypyramis BW_CC]
MDTPARSQSPSTDVQVKQELSPPVQDKIPAYYSLVFPHFTFYVQTLSITIGRRCAPNPHAATSSTAELVQVDVDLGALKSVSRLHAKIEYDHEEDRFVLAVIGRNGAWVDGVWAASGTRTPLGERSQIQIASRVFQFVLPPPPPPEDSPSPSSQSSDGAVRHRSPSLDIETISPPSSQPPNSPPPIEHKLPSPPPEPHIKTEFPLQPRLPNSNSISKSVKSRTTNSSNVKKRKKGDVALLERPKPEDMPPKPPFTYAQLIFKAIKAIGGKATLQEICTWISHTYDYYKYADGAWMSSVRHNLSSGRAFLKMERCGGDRGKGFFWSIDDKHAKALEEQEAKSQVAANGSTQAGSGGKDGSSKGKRKDKGTSLLEPPLKRSIKGDTKGLPLPPPLTNTPLSFKTSTSSTASGTSGRSGSTAEKGLSTPNGIISASPPTTGIFAYPAHPQSSHTVPMQHGSTVTPCFSGTSNVYAALTQTHWGVHRLTSGTITEPSAISTSTTSDVTANATFLSQASTSTQNSHPFVPQNQPSSTSTLTSQSQQPLVPDVVIPIVLGPIPPTHPDYLPPHRNNSAKEGYMILHERKLILDPDVFSGLTPEMLTELEKLGARAALGVLTGHMVRALKEKRVREREKGKDKGARPGKSLNKGNRKAGIVLGRKSGESPSSPFTRAPLEKRSSGTLEDAAISGETTRSMSQPTPRTGDQTDSTMAPPADPGSPIIVVVDSDDEGPAAKKRKVDEGQMSAQAPCALVATESHAVVPMAH